MNKDEIYVLVYNKLKCSELYSHKEIPWEGLECDYKKTDEIIQKLATDISNEIIEEIENKEII